MNISGALDGAKDGSARWVSARKQLIRERLSVSRGFNVEPNPSLAGWTVYAASAVGFLALCLLAVFN